MRFRFLPAAEAELKEAIAWYDAERPGFGQRFFREVSARVDIIRSQPERFERLRIRGLSQETRRALLMKRFPYSIIFRVAKDEIIVVAVAHAKRRPRYWRKRLNE